MSHVPYLPAKKKEVKLGNVLSQIENIKKKYGTGDYAYTYVTTKTNGPMRKLKGHYDS
jgi:hypothetical protein